MSEIKINAALVAAYLDSGVMPQERTAFEGRKYEPSVGQSWAKVTNLPTRRDKYGISSVGTVVSAGIYQVDLCWPKGSGTGEMLAAVDQLMAAFRPHTTISNADQKIKIRRVRRTQIREETAWQSVSVDIYYRASTQQ